MNETKYSKFEENQIAMIDDTIYILNDIYLYLKFMTVHVSSFLR